MTRNRHPSRKPNLIRVFHRRFVYNLVFSGFRGVQERDDSRPLPLILCPKIKESWRSMRPCLRHFYSVLLFCVLSLPALAAKIPVGVMIYEGETSDGSSVFHILLNPPAGVTFDKLTPSFFVDGSGHSFVLPPPQPAPPPLYNFLFLTVPDSGFTSCPCRSATFLFSARTGTKVTFGGKKFVLRRISASFLDPPSGSSFLVQGESATIYLATVAEGD